MLDKTILAAAMFGLVVSPAFSADQDEQDENEIVDCFYKANEYHPACDSKSGDK